jgi:ubiquinone/menaquinone biosynthesis C-methylase UbiE
MVTIAQTTRKYRGRKALTYDSVRQRQRRWVIENEEVSRMLHVLNPVSVLDCPVGTGRFFMTYEALPKIKELYGIDASEEMLQLAHKKMRSRPHTQLHVGDATATGLKDRACDVVVCVRFLDLIDEMAMRRVVAELCRVSRRAIILTIRLGDSYVNKSNTATHDRRAFGRLIGRLGWRVQERVPVFDAGWEIIRLGRRSSSSQIGRRK